MLGIFSLIALSVSLSFGKRLPWSLLPFESGRILWLLVALFLAVLFFNKPLREKTNQAAHRLLSHRLLPQALILWIALYQILSYFLFKGIGYAFPWFNLGICALGLFFIRQGQLLLPMILNLGVLIGSIFAFPINEQRSDMLPVIQGGLNHLLHGTSPFAPFPLSYGEGKMYYLPFAFLSHLPAFLFGLDLRWNQVLYRLLWMGIFYWKARKLPQDHPWRLAALTFILLPYFSFRHDLYFEVFFLFTVVYGFFPKVRMLLLPAMIATRQWIWIFAPFAVLMELRRQGWKRPLAGLLTGSLVTSALIYFPLRSNTSLSQFFQGITGIGTLIAHPGYYGDYGLSFAPVAFWLGIKKWLALLQLGVAAALFGKVILFKANEEKTLRFGFAAWSLCLMLNFHYWSYFWFSPLLMMVIFGIAKALEDKPAR